MISTIRSFSLSDLSACTRSSHYLLHNYLSIHSLTYHQEISSLSSFNHFYLHIFLNPVLRPRIRTNGFYCLRTLYSRAPSNDSFWEEKITQSVEVKVQHKELEKSDRIRGFSHYNDSRNHIIHLAACVTVHNF